MSEIRARLATSAAEIGASAWNACANPDGQADPHPFTRYEFFAALEQSGSATARQGWQPRASRSDRSKLRLSPPRKRRTHRP